MRRFLALAALLLSGACSQALPPAAGTAPAAQSFIDLGAYEGGGRYYVAPGPRVMAAP